MVEEEKYRYQQMIKFVKSLGHDWFLFTFEDMAANKFDALNNYLGFEIHADATVPSSSGKAKVIRKRSTGDWRHWFTEEDADLFKPLTGHTWNSSVMIAAIGRLIGKPVIEPEFSSVYMQNLPRKATKNVILRFLDPIIHRLT